MHYGWNQELQQTGYKSNLYVRLALVSDRLPQATANPKHQNFPSQSVTVGISCKLPPPRYISDRDHFLSLTVKDFPLFLTPCKRLLDAFSDLYFSLYALSYLEHTKNFSDTMQFDILCARNFSRKKPPWPLWFDSCKRPNPISDHSVFAFWLVAYGRFECISKMMSTIGMFQGAENRFWVWLFGVLYQGPGLGQPIFSREI